MKRKTTTNLEKTEVDCKKKKRDKSEMLLQRVTPERSQILSAEELKEKIRRDEEYKRKLEFRKKLDVFVYGDYIEGYLRYVIECENNHQPGIDKLLLDACLSDYYTDAPSKTLKELLEEKDWEIFDLNETNYGISAK